jgi:hypothetical protein
LCFSWINEFLDQRILAETPRAFPRESHSPIIQFIRFFVAAGIRESNKKPTTVSSRGLLSKFNLTTIANGVVSYDDDYQSDLSNIV